MESLISTTCLQVIFYVIVQWHHVTITIQGVSKILAPLANNYHIVPANRPCRKEQWFKLGNISTPINEVKAISSGLGQS
ncbi:MAG: hypothetical protein CVU68_04160 [Deltaproteobacteria bacterium HGW-Deltaproteobacteria-3]|nr:MAG: hypothetical protein CVU68_04160 [Deltaproteobacteria bacterium HGW-Deltaproteobacteria-3]